jgi:hypothetical protein
MQVERSESEHGGKSFARHRGCAAYLHRGRTFQSRRISQRGGLAAQRTTCMRRCRVTLDDEDIEQIARRVAELIGSTRAQVSPRYVDAAALARILGIERDWVYAHARELGAVRLGGPGGRLRFDVRQVADVLARPDAAPPTASGTSSRRRGSRAARAEVIQYER